MGKNDNITSLRNLSAARKVRHEQFSKSLNNIRTELKPDNLMDRISKSTKERAAVMGDKIGDKARSNPAAILAIGGAVLTAALYQPVKSAIKRLGDDGDSEADYDDIDWSA